MSKPNTKKLELSAVIDVYHQDDKRNSLKRNEVTARRHTNTVE
ncbi:hypothetical protein PMU79_10625 [Enterococcus durans]|nr:hypothetical protein [Enterococcus sp. BSD2780061688st2 D3]MDB1680049.1 hypothetical protein [Enterococcus durans]